LECWSQGLAIANSNPLMLDFLGIVFMRILFYCQYVFGMGHLFRSVELLRGFAGHEVVLAAGGREVETVLPAHIRLERLPPLYMDEAFTTLIAGESDRSVDQIQRDRKNMLFSLIKSLRPNLFITELYPFGRSFFEFEMIPLLSAIREGVFGDIKVVCSLRDVLVEKRDPEAFEQRVLDRLNRFYDLLLIHSDEQFLPLTETFTRVGDIRIPIHYTGFVTKPADRRRGQLLRKELRLTPEKKLIVASAGGGRSGYPLLKGVIEACRLLRNSFPLQLCVFTGPFIDDRLYQDLKAREAASIRIQRFSKRFMDYLVASDLSISMAGYNTCMNLLVTGVPALVYPYSRQQEQPMRARKLNQILPLKILTEADIAPESLAEHIQTMLRSQTDRAKVDLNLNGAENTLQILTGFSP
jgi:predicted glycosyltransferase